jgi:hypothetical protein
LVVADVARVDLADVGGERAGEADRIGLSLGAGVVVAAGGREMRRVRGDAACPRI